MVIIHKIGDFLFDLFPKVKESGNNMDVLKKELEAYYSFGIYKPQVSITEGFVKIMIDIETISSQKKEFDKATALCDKRKFSEAKIILEKLAKENPTISEYHRVLGQIYSEEGNQEEAINILIDALKWDSKNGHALIMMGNIFANFKNDIDTANKYFIEAVAQDPKDYIAFNNLGKNLIQQNKWGEALKYFEKAREITPNYPNANYGIAFANDKLENTLIAFEYSISCLKNCRTQDETLFNHALALAMKTAKEWCDTKLGNKYFNEYKTALEKSGGTEIKVEVNPKISTPAKIEFAEIYNRDFHLIKHKENYRAVEHLMMHELVHLDFAIQAKKEKNNMLFYVSNDKKEKFIRDNFKFVERMNKGRFTEDSIANFLGSMFDGMNNQIFNCPVDLFIEDFLYLKYNELRPYQFISLYGLVNEGKNAVTDARATELVPKEILSASKILNIVNAIHFKDLYGVELIAKFNAQSFELKEAKRMYEEYNEYRKDREAGEEYELVQHWGGDLKLNNYFEFVNEEDFRSKPADFEGLLDSIEKDPFDLQSNKKIKEKEMDEFQKSAQRQNLNMAVVRYMMDAMQYFKKLPPNKIKEIAHEIGLIGAHGISTDGDHKYKLSNIPHKDFSGYHLLAYNYVSWSIAIPEMLSEINLPYEKEFSMAKKMFEAESE